MTQSSPNSLPVSVEFFPPKTPEGVEKLAAVRQQLYAIRPEYCSVTYGAGGSTQEGTLQAVRAILSEGCDAAPHFSCIGASKASVRAELAQFRAEGIQRIVALRGDLPSGYGGLGEFRYASDLVAFIREETADHFQIEVAAYPEMHPQARNPQADLQAYVTKVKAGADVALTQYFFNSDAYFRFVDEAEALGATIPVPRWIRTRLEGFGDDKASIQAFGLDVVTELCEQLRSVGVPGLHFYTMNQAAPVLAICARLGLTPA